MSHMTNGISRYCAPALLLALLLLPAAALASPMTVARTVWPLYYTTGADGHPDGGCTSCTIIMDPTDKGGVRVGFFESEFFGAGAQWRASGWMAAVVASMVAGQPLDQWRISYDVEGYMDGPSAGGLMTSTVLSGMLGHKILPQVTMTGTINPDGSIGPVGGIYYKLLGAKRKGMKKVLIPAGHAMEDLDGDKKANLLERGKSLGLEVVEVADIYEAYSHLTGKKLLPPADDGQELKLPEEAVKALRHSYDRWEKKYKEAMREMNVTRGDVPADLHPKMAKFWDVAQKSHDRAGKLLEGGYICAAMQMMYVAANQADTGAYMSLAYAAYASGGLKGMEKALREMTIDPKFLESFRIKLVKVKPANLSDMMALTEAFSYYAAAVGVHLGTENTLAKLDKIEDPMMRFQVLEGATMAEAVARNFSHFVDDLLYMGLGHPGPPLPDMESLGTWTSGMFRAAGANLGYIQKAIVEPLAEEINVSPQFVLSRLLGSDNYYGLASTTFMAGPELRDRMDSTMDRTLAMLGGATVSYGLSCMVVAKYYCLGAVPDPKTGMVKKLLMAEGLEPMLVSSRGRLRATIAQAKALGCTPVIPIFHLRSGLPMMDKSQDIDSRLVALGEFWIGSTYARLMSILAAK